MQGQQAPGPIDSLGLVSTTKLMRNAIELHDGNVDGAVRHLLGITYDYPNAKSAARVLQQRSKGAARVEMTKGGFIQAVAA
jgi:hypothetical protein